MDTALVKTILLSWWDKKVKQMAARNKHYYNVNNAATYTKSL